MKRIFLVFVTVMFIVGGTGVFAQGLETGGGSLTFNGKIASGVSFDIDSTNNKDGTFQMLNMSYPDNPYRNSLRADLYTAFTKGNGGFKFALRADDVINRISGGGGLYSVPYAFGWLDLLNNKFRITGGKIEDNVWGTMGLVNATITAAGVRLEARPVDGLNAGVFFVVPGGTSIPQSTTKFASPKQTFMETIIGARYYSRMFWASALLQLDSDFDRLTPAIDPTGGTINDDKEMRALFGLGLTFIPNLTVLAEADIWGLGAVSDQGRVDLRQTFSYNITNKVSIALRAQELLWTFSDDLKPWLEFKPLLTYKINNIVTTVLEGGFGLGNYGETDLTPVELGAIPMGHEKLYNVYIKPTGLFTLDGGLAVKTWYKFNVSEKKDEDLATAHQAALEFVWSF
jgi:hypothetical protein